jgi:hypothetical protein
MWPLEVFVIENRFTQFFKIGWPIISMNWRRAAAWTDISPSARPT